MDHLTKREKQIGSLLAKGMKYKEISHALGIGVSTVHYFVKRVYKKLNVGTKAELILQYAPAFRAMHGDLREN